MQVKIFASKNKNYFTVIRALIKVMNEALNPS